MCNKKNIIKFIKSDSNSIFGGFCKIGFKTNPIKSLEYKVDNNAFLFSVNLKKIFPVITD